MPLIPLGIAWLAGIVLASTMTFPPVALAPLAALASGLLAIFRRNFWVRWTLLCLLAALLGALRYGLAQPQFDERSLAAYNNRGVPATITGLVVSEPDVRDTYTRLRVKAHHLSLGNGPAREVHGLALVNAPRYPEYDYGDELSITGSLETPPVFDAFDYRAYLARQGVHSQLRYAEGAPLKIERLSQGGGFRPYAALLTFKRRAQGVIAHILPEPQASLLTGILLGVESGIPAKAQDAFRITGTSHIIAISGFNMTILAGLLGAIAVRVFGRRYAFYVISVGLMFYTLLVGAGAAVVRAALMSGLSVLALHLGRRGLAINSLFAAAIIMTIGNPYLVWDVGFQLSFAATLGLVIYTERFQSFFESQLSRLLPIERARKIVAVLNDALIITLAAQLTTLPILAVVFKQVSPVSLLTNLLVLPAQPGVMIVGGLATLAGLVWLPAGQVIGWGAWLFLTWTIGLIELTAQLPAASLSLGEVHVGWAATYYAGLAALTWLCALPAERRAELRAGLAARLGRIKRRYVLGGLTAAVALAGAALLKLPDGKLHVDFLDVGYGDAVFIQTPNGRWVLVDAGTSPSTILDHLGRRLPFWSHAIDVALIARGDDAHLAAWAAVLERYQVGLVMWNGDDGNATPIEQTPAALKLSQVIAKQPNARLMPAPAGTRVQLDEGVELDIIGAPELITDTASLSVRLAYGQASFILAGESAPPAGWPPGLVLRLARGGSQWSNSPEMLAAINPGLAVISVDADNRYGLPAAEVLQGLAGRTLLRTDQRGSIDTRTDGTQVEVWPER